MSADQRDQKEGAAPLTLTMKPACRVSGQLRSIELVKRNRGIGPTYVELSIGVQGVGSFEPDHQDQRFYFFLPPGDFALRTYGDDLHVVNKTITVKPGQGELQLGTIDLPATQLALLQGMAAPELREVVAWKNSRPLRLGDLKGKVVIVDFWGYWCQPCVHQMPELFKLYDIHRHEGLEIVGIHVDRGGRENERVDSVRKLDERLSAIRKDFWDGRDVPYPVAIVEGKETPFGPGIELTARSPSAADYGVQGYPTMVLIDRNGIVVGRFRVDEKEDLERLKKLIRDK